MPHVRSFVFVALSTLLSGGAYAGWESACPGTPKKVEKVCGCRPSIQQLRDTLHASGLDDALITDTSSCLEGDASAVATGQSLASGDLKACIGRKRTIDGDTLSTISRLVEQVYADGASSEEYDSWLECYQRVLNPPDQAPTPEPAKAVPEASAQAEPLPSHTVSIVMVGCEYGRLTVDGVEQGEVAGQTLTNKLTVGTHTATLAVQRIEHWYCSDFSFDYRGEERTPLRCSDFPVYSFDALSWALMHKGQPLPQGIRACTP